MLLNDFSGGKNTRVAAHLLQPNEAQIYTNINNESGSLVPLNGHLDTGVVIDPYYTWYIAGNEWVSFTNPSEFVEYRDKLYISSDADLQVYHGGVSHSLGITKPSTKVITEVISGVESLVSVSTVADSGDFYAGTYTYLVRISSSITGSDIFKTYTHVTALGSIGVKNVITVDIQNDTNTADGDMVYIYRWFDEAYRLLHSSPIVAISPVVIDDTELNIGGVDAYILPTEATYSYVYTYYNSLTGEESQPSLPSIEITANLGTIMVKPIPKSDEPIVDTIRVYRIGGSLTAYTLVKELSNPLIVTAEFLDTAEDIDVAGSEVLDSLFNSKPISGLRYITEAYAMLFAAKDDKLYYSDIAKPYAWPTSNFIDFEENITGIGAAQSGLLVFTKYKTYIITGNSPQAFSKYLLSGSQGCINHNTIQFVDNNLLWVSQDGLCTSNGGLINVVSLNKVGKLYFQSTYGSAVVDNVYYLNYYTIDGGAILSFDFRYNQIIRDVALAGNGLVAAKDTLYQEVSGTLKIVGAGEPLDMHYKSPMLTDGSYSNYKIYKDIYVKYEGSLTFIIYVDGKLINTIQLTGEGCKNIKLATTARGYGIEFEISGTGIVQEIEYKAEGRQNGR